jgi:hypothetical protein
MRTKFELKLVPFEDWKYTKRKFSITSTSFAVVDGNCYTRLTVVMVLSKDTLQLTIFSTDYSKAGYIDIDNKSLSQQHQYDCRENSSITIGELTVSISKVISEFLSISCGDYDIAVSRDLIDFGDLVKDYGSEDRVMLSKLAEYYKAVFVDKESDKE